MLNLLPPEQKQELLSEEKFKLVLILGIIIIAFLISFALILISIKISLSAELEIQKINFEQKEKEFKSSVLQETDDQIQKANLVFSQLESFYRGQRDFIQIFEKIFQSLPQGTYLTNLNFNPAFSQMALAGFAPTWEILLELKENLEKESDFYEVYFPPANWISASDIDFTLTFKIGR